MRAPSSDLPDIAADILERLRERRPRVHCITNAVAQNFTANVLLAAGPIPSMTISPDEVADFAASADAVLINLGTFDADRRAASETAIAQIRFAGRPWVLDPVLIDRSPPRADFARKLMAQAPAAIRLNEAEFKTLAASDRPEQYAVSHRAIVAITGETDLITDGERVISIANGHPLMARVTVMGCAETALVAAALTAEQDRLKAVASAVLLFGLAGELAGDAANGPGSFAVHILDALFNLDRATIRARAKVSS
jgi:hydroxyethylthiazole kinase